MAAMRGTAQAMRIEQAYPGEALRHLWGGRHPYRLRPMVYYTTGEFVEVGAYHCTYCGCAHLVRRPTPLPLCPTCDGSEFIVARRVAEPLAGDWLEEADLIA